MIKQQNDIWAETDRLVQEKHVPINMILELTRRCNLNCLHCYNVKDEKELNLEQVKDIFRQLREAGCLFLTLTGGEIFTREDILEIIALAKRSGFDLKLITNGTLINEDIVDHLVNFRPSEIGVSLLGATADTHEEITGMPGSFTATVSAVKMMKKKELPVHIKCTLMKENIHEYQAVVELADSLEVNHIIDPLISPKDDGSKCVLKHRLGDSKLKKFYSEQLKSLQFEKSPSEGFPCDAGKTFGAISANGDVFPCIQIPISIGNMLTERFLDIWEKAPLLKRIRNFQRQDSGKCATCSNSDGCTRCPGLAYLEEGNLFGPSPTACLIADVTNRYLKKE